MCCEQDRLLTCVCYGRYGRYTQQFNPSNFTERKFALLYKRLKISEILMEAEETFTTQLNLSITVHLRHDFPFLFSGK
jgi:hypothetical protein